MERDFLYAEDAVSAYLAVAGSLDRPELRGRAWNASIGRPMSVLALVTRLVEISGLGLQPDVRGQGTPHGEIERQWLDCSAISADLGWQPAWDMQRGLQATFAWYASELARLTPSASPAAHTG
jgi:CDP-glucose 4,6-dehydratase